MSDVRYVYMLFESIDFAVCARTLQQIQFSENICDFEKTAYRRIDHSVCAHKFYLSFFLWHEERIKKDTHRAYMCVPNMTHVSL